MKKFVLKLFVTGRTTRSEMAMGNLKDLIDNELAGQYELEVIDVLERPQLAEDERILATPTLIRKLPDPIRRIIGDLSNREQVLQGLDLRPNQGAHKEQGGNS